MNSFKIAIASTVIAASLIGVSVPVNASAQCSINGKLDGLSLFNLTDKNTTIQGDTITTKLVVSGEEGCTKTASVGVWKWSTELGLPLSSQKLYKSTTKIFGVGEHTLSIQVPNCKWQADIMEGSRATAADGSADYKIGDPSNPNSDRFLDVAYGGSQVCADQVPVSTKTDNTTPVSVSQLPSTGFAGNTSVVISALLGTITATGYAIIRKFKNQR